MTNNETDIKKIAVNAKNASCKLASLTEDIKNRALDIMAKKISENTDRILEANKKDLERGERLIKSGVLSLSLFNRLKLDEEKIKVIIKGIDDVKNLEDPVNITQWAMELDKGLELYRVSCPIGVIGVIFESRPDVVPQVVSLAVKSANAVILKGGSESELSNEILIEIILQALKEVPEFPDYSVNLIKTRHDVRQMLSLSDYIDLLIPRGSNQLVKYIKENTNIPVLGHTEGLCHVYIDEYADFEKAVKISVDSKIQYPAACNAVETVLVHKNIAENILPELITALLAEDVLVKGDTGVQKIFNAIEPASEEDWKTEYCDKIVSIKIVDSINDAIDHINKYGSGHTDAIITENKENAKLFMNFVDSSGVYHNASTRFADGFRYGLGAEVGISTNKTHARGPVGLEGLVIYKYKLYGSGNIVADYSGNSPKQFTHNLL